MKTQSFFQLFALPAFVIAGIILYSFLYYVVGEQAFATYIIALTIFAGSIDLLKDTFTSILKRKFALDYIALLAITTGVVSGEFLVSAVIVLMLTGGQTLEKYAVSRAKGSLTKLTDRIPKHVLLWVGDTFGDRVEIESVKVGQKIYVRKGEVIPLDGILRSDTGYSDESSLTGEPYEIEKKHGDTVRSGTINIGTPMIIEVTKEDRESTYRKIVEMVAQAQDERSPFIRIADKYSTVFTLITVLIATAAYLVTRDIRSVLAVLVIATPCPLILATPIALIGGVNAMARKKIIAKTLTAIETLSRVTDIMFDKTGTITLGKPVVTEVKIYKKQYSLKYVLSIISAIERNSLHPVAKAIVEYASQFKSVPARVTDISERIGHGITGTVDGRRYTVAKSKNAAASSVELKTGSRRIASIYLEDQPKHEAKDVLQRLTSYGISISIYTGDKEEATRLAVAKIGITDIDVKTQCSPKDKLNGIKKLRNVGRSSAMVGDGINDAPALAAADVGIVFANGEQTASSEAADIVLLGGSFSLVAQAYLISRRTIAIAKESIFIGIGLSTLGMLFAAMGYIPPIVGAFIQEAIDVGVIINALRASKS